MEFPTKEFTVTAKSTLVAFIRDDERKTRNEVAVLFSPHIDLLRNEGRHQVSSWFIRVQARKAALELASEFSGMDISDLRVRENEGVGMITIIPREGLTYPVDDTSVDDLTAAEHMIRTSNIPQRGDNSV